MSPLEVPPVRAYGYRWVVLGAFMFLNLTCQILWICFSPVMGPAARHYGVSDSARHATPTRRPPR